MKKVGCSNLSIALIVLGIFPLIGGTFGLVKTFEFIEKELNYSWLFQSVILVTVGAAACGFRSCLYLSDSDFVFRKSVWFFNISNVSYSYSNFEEIFVDMGTTTTTTEAHDEPTYYFVSLNGRNKRIDISDYLRFNRNVQNDKSWILVKDVTNTIKASTHLSVSYSGKVKSYNPILK